LFQYIPSGKDKYSCVVGFPILKHVGFDDVCEDHKEFPFWLIYSEKYNKLLWKEIITNDFKFTLCYVPTTQEKGSE
jgi:hypothetical protein